MRNLAILLVLAASAAADVVVLHDGTILTGDPAKGEKTLTVGARKVDLADVLLWEGQDTLPRYAPTPLSHYRGCIALAERDVLKLCLERLPKAVEAKDAATAARLLARAEKAGLDAKSSESWDARVDKLGDGGGTSDVKVPGREVLVADLIERAQKLLEKDKLRALYLLRYALRLDPRNKTGLEMLSGESPRRWKLGDDRNWLDWYIAVLHRARKLPRRSPDLGRAKKYWGRKDLVGLETNHLILITPLPNPGPIRMCIELGDLTCAALDAMFKVDTPKRDEFLPLIVYFYENKAEYIRLGTGKPSARLAMTAGFYTPSENISRFFWPKNRGAQAGVRDTFVHELTHHWIERRNPRWHERDLVSVGQRTTIPGYWIGEGFATFIQHSRLDPVKRTWTFFNPHAHSLDVVASVSKSGSVFDWNEVYTLTQAEFHGKLTKTGGKAHARIKGRWTIWPHPISKIRLFYEQSSATCMFLYWGENGKYRQQLLDYVTNFYTSKKDMTDIKAAFGLEPAELGKKVEEFAIAVVDKGFRPDLKK